MYVIRVEYENYAWGHVRNGWLIDEHGQISRYHWNEKTNKTSKKHVSHIKNWQKIWSPMIEDWREHQDEHKLGNLIGKAFDAGTTKIMVDSIVIHIDGVEEQFSLDRRSRNLANHIHTLVQKLTR